MNKRVLGRTGLLVSELGLGGLFVSSVGGPYEQAREAVHRALELGINYVDTAPGYRDSEQVLGMALEGVTQPYVLSTKLGGRPQPFNPQDKDQLLCGDQRTLLLRLEGPARGMRGGYNVRQTDQGVLRRRRPGPRRRAPGCHSGAPRASVRPPPRI